MSPAKAAAFETSIPPPTAQARSKHSVEAQGNVGVQLVGWLGGTVGAVQQRRRDAAYSRHTHAAHREEWPQRNSNPCLRLERPPS